MKDMKNPKSNLCIIVLIVTEKALSLFTLHPVEFIYLHMIALGAAEVVCILTGLKLINKCFIKGVPVSKKSWYSFLNYLHNYLLSF
nr:hypothetical protein [Ectobacillus panaciterrae]